jgi:hypothetical protein
VNVAGVQSSIGVSPVSPHPRSFVMENPLALRSIDTLGVRHRRDAYATLNAGSQPQRVHIRLARHSETGNLCSSQTTRNSEPRTQNRAHGFAWQNGYGAFGTGRAGAHPYHRDARALIHSSDQFVRFPAYASTSPAATQSSYSRKMLSRSFPATTRTPL